MTDDDLQAAHRAASAITRAAQQYLDATDRAQRDTMTDALIVHTRGFTRQQFLVLVSDLAALLATFYGRDELAADAAVTDAELHAWLAG